MTDTPSETEALRAALERLMELWKLPWTEKRYGEAQIILSQIRALKPPLPSRSCRHGINPDECEFCDSPGADKEEATRRAIAANDRAALASLSPPRMTDLEARLVRLRLLLHSEVPGKINQHATPVLRDFEDAESVTDEGGVGMPMTAAMHRYLSGPDHWGLARLGMLSIIEVSEACASKHPVHRRPMFTRTVCAQLIFEAAYLGQDLIDLVWLHPELTYPQIHGQLDWALRHAEEWRATMFARWSKVPGEQEPMPERVRGVA